MDILTPTDWKEYELIDTGNREKLERFGQYILIRPEPQAVWKKALPESDWETLAHARFSRAKPSPSKNSPTHHTTNSPYHQPTTSPTHHGTTAPRHRTSPSPRHPVTSSPYTEERGEWSKKPGMPDQWVIGYQYKEMSLNFRLGLTAFGHVGLFPEQAENWKYVFDRITAMRDEGRETKDEGRRTKDEGRGTRDKKREARSEKRNANSQQPIANSEQRTANGRPRILNLFAYTGGASLAAKAAGADVVHVDSVKQVINWAREDMELSGLDGIRWVVEDALKFVRREVKRGNRYDGIILDPPAYGRGPEGEKWLLEEYIDEMIGLCAEFLIPHWLASLRRAPLRSGSSFLILSLYSMGFSPLIGENLLRTHFGNDAEIQTGELGFSDRAGRILPLGTVARFG